MSIQKLRLKDISTHEDAQPRNSISTALCTEYAEEIEGGATFPPVVVFFEKPAFYWLADGYHRYQAHDLAEQESIAADVRKGGLREAILYSCGANAQHGSRRTNHDKRRAVRKLLQDEDWAKWSDSEIARRAAVSDRFVNQLRMQLSSNGSKIETKRKVTRNGTTYEQDTTNIGKAKPSPTDWTPPKRTHTDTDDPELTDGQLREVNELITNSIRMLASADVTPAGFKKVCTEPEAVGRALDDAHAWLCGLVAIWED